MIGKYVNVGFNNDGSFGTSASMQSSYYSDRIGFICDYDKNGFSEASLPSFSGDYFIPGAPLEGISSLSMRPMRQTNLN